MNADKANELIVVGVDGSRFGLEALRWALAEAQRRECGVRALLVAHVSPVVAAGRPSTVGMASALSAEPDQEYVRRLQDTVQAVLGEHDDPSLTAQVVHGSAPETLCAASADAQLLVIGSHGHGQMLETVLGSVARYCVHNASCPVVVIPARLAAPADKAAVTDEPAGRPPQLSYGPGPLL